MFDNFHAFAIIITDSHSSTFPLTFLHYLRKFILKGRKLITHNHGEFDLSNARPGKSKWTLRYYLGETANVRHPMRVS